MTTRKSKKTPIYRHVDIGKTLDEKRAALLENHRRSCFAVGKGEDIVTGIIGESNNGTYTIPSYSGGYTLRRVKDLTGLFVMQSSQSSRHFRVEPFYEKIDIGRYSNKKKRILLQNEGLPCFAVNDEGIGIPGILGECENGTYELIYDCDEEPFVGEIKNLTELFITQDRDFYFDFIGFRL